MKKVILFLALCGGLAGPVRGQSDPQAVAVAQAVMQAQGGQKAWEQTRYLQWNFFGNRRLTWDRYTGDVRIEYLKQPLVTLVNVNTRKGRVFRQGQEETRPDSLQQYLNEGYRAWTNDSYWLLMPYKLLDPGVTLRYLGTESTETGRPADKLQLTFSGVGITPQNRYFVWVDKSTRLVSQWAYFPKAEQEKPAFVNPWKDYRRYGKIMLSGDRGNRRLTEISVKPTLSANTFKTL